VRWVARITDYRLLINDPQGRLASFAFHWRVVVAVLKNLYNVLHQKTFNAELLVLGYVHTFMDEGFTIGCLLGSNKNPETEGYCDRSRRD